jgi:GNAT superfamily N-acetyltransferase
MKGKVPKLKVKITDGNWIEVYTAYEENQRGRPKYQYSYCLGFIDQDGKGIITDVWLDPSLRGSKLGSRMVNMWKNKASSYGRTVAHNIQPEAEGFWEKKGIKETEKGERARVQKERDRFLSEEWQG